MVTLTDAQRTQVEQLREVMARDYQITDTPTWDPAVRYTARPVFRLALRSPLTRRQILDQLDPEARAAREQQITAFMPELDLDSPEIVETTVHAYVDRRIERADPQRWESTSGPLPPTAYGQWLRDQVMAHIPDGYTILGRWEDYARPEDLLRAALADRDNGPAGLTEAVRNALARGMSGPKIAAVLGVAPARVYQIRDGKR
jgi:hypothetical protein